MFDKLTQLMAQDGGAVRAAPPAAPAGQIVPLRPAPEEAPEPEDASYHVHLLGRQVDGPFASMDEDGGPRIELYEMVDATDRHGRACMKPSLIGEFDRSVTRAELLESDDEDLGPRWYKVLVRGADGTPIPGAVEMVDLRRPADRRRRMRHRSRPEREAPAAVGTPFLELQQRVDAAVDAERRRMQAHTDQVVGAIERERDHWRDRAERAEHRFEEARQAVIDLRIENAGLRAGGGGGLDSFDQLTQMVERAHAARDLIDRLAPQSNQQSTEAPPAHRPTLPEAVLSGLRDLRGAVSDITELGALIKGAGGGNFKLQRG